MRAVAMIRLGAPADHPAAAAIYRRASLSNAGDRAALIAHPEHLVLIPDGLAEGRTFVAEQDGSVVGFATWSQAEDGLELEDLFVDPRWMRRGIATALLAHVVDAVRARGASCLRVTANPHALAFYRAAGFVDIGDTATDFGPAARMALMID